MPLSPSISGIWIVRTRKHLQDFVSPNLSYYDATITAGQCGQLMSRLRKLEIVEYDKLRALAADLSILPSQLNAVVLPNLEKAGIVNSFKDGSGKIEKITENVPTIDAIFPIVTEIWKSHDANEIEMATIEGQEISSHIPLPESEFSGALASVGISPKNLDIALDLQSSFNILGKVGEAKETLVYSEYSWGEVMKKGGKWMSKLEGSQRFELEQLISRIGTEQGLPEVSVNYSSDTFRAAKNAGLVRSCTIRTSTGDMKDFVFTPSVGEIFSDENDEVKAFLASLRYGENYAHTSKIISPLWIVNALIERSEHTIGPATDIGTDYVLLEKAGIVKVERANPTSDRHYMTLIKDDVARKVREVIKHGTVSGLQEQKLDTLLSPNSMTTPEHNRIRMGKLAGSAKKAEEDLFKVFRRETL